MSATPSNNQTALPEGATSGSQQQRSYWTNLEHVTGREESSIHQASATLHSYASPQNSSSRANFYSQFSNLQFTEDSQHRSSSLTPQHHVTGQFSTPYPQNTRFPSNPFSQKIDQPPYNIGSNSLATQNPQNTNVTSNTYVQNTNVTSNPYAQNTNLPSNPYPQYTNVPSNPYPQNTNAPSNSYAQNANLPSNPYVQNTNVPSNSYAQNANLHSNPFVQNTNAPSNSYAQNANLPSNPYVQNTNVPSNPFVQNTNVLSNHYAQNTQQFTTPFIPRANQFPTSRPRIPTIATHHGSRTRTPAPFSSSTFHHSHTISKPFQPQPIPQTSSFSNPKRFKKPPVKVIKENQKKFCEICKIVCSTDITYEEHLKGAKHKKKLQEKEKIEATEKPTGFWCKLCTLTCNSKLSFEQHLAGTNHAKIAKLYQQLGKEIPPIEINKSPPKESVEKETEESNIEPIGLDQLEEEQSSNSKIATFRCKICECSVTQGNQKNHCIGKRHQENYKQKIDPQHFVVGKKRTLEEDFPFLNAPISLDDKYMLRKNLEISIKEHELESISKLVAEVEEAIKLIRQDFKADDKTILKLYHEVGSYRKGLLMAGQTQSDLVITCDSEPTESILEQLSQLLQEKLSERKVATDDRKIVIESDDVSVRITLEKQECNSSHAVHQAKWFKEISWIGNSLQIICRIFKDLQAKDATWAKVDTWTLEYAVGTVLLSFGRPHGLAQGFYHVLKAISEHDILSNLQDPWSRTLEIPESEDLKALQTKAKEAMELVTSGRLHEVLGLEPFPRWVGKRRRPS